MNTNAFIVSSKQMDLDMDLVPYDLWASKVHVLMLAKQQIIEKKIAKKILIALLEIENEATLGKFSIDPNKGLHLTIEAKVIEKIGDDGYFMHTARSRNDQVMTCELLYLKEKILSMTEQLLNVQRVLLKKATENISTIMPGITHMQPAKPTTFGQWNLSYTDMFMKCLETVKYVYEKYDLCPLGSVESYGTSWPIDRKFTATLLGFSSVWEIPQEAISSRGFPQLACLGFLKDIAIVVGKMASDLLLFTTFEFGYVTLSDGVAKQMGSITGSSIMPQKKNPDALELLRSVSSQLIGFESIVANLLSNLPMGYNRDTREVKEYTELGFSKAGDCLYCLMDVLKSLKVNTKIMHQSVLDNYSLSTDLSDSLCQKSHVPFRKMYTVVGSLVKKKITQGIPLYTLSPKELFESGKKLGISLHVSKGELKQALDPFFAISNRNHVGGSAPRVMKKMITERKKRQLFYSNWIKLSNERIDLAKKSTNSAVKMVTL